MFIHELPDVKDLFNIIADERKVLPYLVEKDYWIMHALWSLKEQGFKFELKGGTSLSKAYKIIERFSEDLDIKIIPEDPAIATGKNHDKPAHITSRKKFFNDLVSRIKIPGMKASRDYEYDDEKMRNAGIILNYQNLFSHIEGVKKGVLLEIGFDQTEPNQKMDISSWAYEKVKNTSIEIKNNKAIGISCYLPEYTFVEKLQAVSTKVRLGTKDFGFLRHFYDIFALLHEKSVIDFLGTENYQKHKKNRFRTADNLNILENLAFNLDNDQKLFRFYQEKYEDLKPLFIGKFYSFDFIYEKIKEYRELM